MFQCSKHTVVPGYCQLARADILTSKVNKSRSPLSLTAFLGHRYARTAQARDVGLVNKNTQWYLNGETAMDGIFTVSDTHHDSQLAYDLRGTLGVRACPPIEG